jgi:hypothetical protein
MIAKFSARQQWGKNEFHDIREENVHGNSRAVFVEEIVTEMPSFDEDGQPVMLTVAVLDENGNQVLGENDQPIKEDIQAVDDVITYKFKIPVEYEVEVIECFDDEQEIKKEERDRILKGSDWLFVSDVPVPTSYRNYYRDYRTSLRSLNVEVSSIEVFEDFLRRTQPGEFMDGGDGVAIVAKFNYYL